MPLFGKKKKAVPPKESIQKLRETLEMLEKREQFLQKKAEGQVAEAKKFMAQKNKRGKSLPRLHLPALTECNSCTPLFEAQEGIRDAN